MVGRRLVLGVLAGAAAVPALAQPRRDPPPDVADPRASHFVLGPPGRQ